MKITLLRLIGPFLFLTLIGCLDDASVSENLSSSIEVDEIILDDVIDEVIDAPIDVPTDVVDEEPAIDEEVIVVDAPVVDVPVIDEPVVIDLPVVEEEPVKEDPVVVEEEPVAETPVVIDTPVVEEPVEEPPVVVEEKPVVEVPVVDLPVVEEPIQCVDKKSYILKNAGVSTKINTYMSPLPAYVNYNYYSWSAHPIVGSTPKGFEGQFFLYEDGESSVSLNFIFSVDAGGASYDEVSLDVKVLNNESDDKVILSDDRLEVKKLSSENGESVYQAKMRYWKNTDGGVIGSFKGDDLKIQIQLNGVGENKEINFYSSNGEKVALSSNFEIIANGEVEECSVNIVKEEEKYVCLESEYLAKKDEIEDAKWMEEYHEMISDRNEQISELRETQGEEYKEVRARLNEEITLSVKRFKEVREVFKTDRKGLIAKYQDKHSTITEIYKKEREELIAELDTKIEEVKAEESTEVCTEQKGFFGFLKKLFCKVVKFVGKIIGALFSGFENFMLKILEKLGLLDVEISSSSELLEVKSLALSKLDVEYEESIDSLVLERKLKISELKESYLLTRARLKEEITLLRENRTVILKALRLEQTTVRQLLSKTLTEKAKDFRSGAIKIQDAVHKEFTQLVQKCL